MTKARVKIRVSGFVQGVSYRWTARAEGARLGLSGWVRNVRSGGVEAAVEGEQGAVDAFIDWCWHGPPQARVDDVVVDREPFAGDLAGFLIERTVD